MRRNSEGVVEWPERNDDRVKRAEAEAERTIRILSPHVTDPRKVRLMEVIEKRLSSVAVAFDAPYDPHNGAAVLRSCEAFGVQQLHVIERPGIRFTVASTVARGAECWVDVARYTAVEEVVHQAEAQQMELVATHPDGELLPADLSKIGRILLVLGNERDGIREELMATCKRRVRVPMRGFVESLNVSVTAAILLHAATDGRPGDLDAATKRRLYARGLYHSLTRASDILSFSPPG